MIKIVSTNSYKVSGIKVLVYGDAGVGKTVLCSTCPAPIILSAESGLLSLRKFNLPVIEVKTVDDLTEVHTWLSSSKDAQQFETICLDSVTEIAEVVLANAKGVVKDPRQAYGEMIDKMSMVIRAFRDLPGRNVYFSAKQEPNKDEFTGSTRWGPSMPGSKLAGQLPFFFDEVFRLAVGKTKEGQSFRYLQTQPDLQCGAKDRSGILQPAEPPDLGHIFKRIAES